MFEIKDRDVSIITRLCELETKIQTARYGKEPNCKMCDSDGNIKVLRSSFFKDTLKLNISSSQYMREMLDTHGDNYITMKCDCYSLAKTELHKEISKLFILQDNFRNVFGLSKHTRKEIEALTLSSYGKMFGVESISETIEKWLIHGMPCSLFFTGRPGTGKTTCIKILWQVMALNGYSVYFFNCQEFEKLCLNLYNKNEDRSIGNRINSMVSVAKQVDLLLIDDHACMNMNTALMYLLPRYI